MEFRILGRLQVLDGQHEVPLGSPKGRELLAVLLLHAGAVVSRERLIAELWGESPPPTAAKALNVHVSQLRKALARNGEQPITTQAPGYALRIKPECLDAAGFERLVAEARERVATGDLERARRLLREALSLWRGPVLDGVELQAAARNEAARLQELRLAAHMDRIDCDLSLGLHDHVIGELEALVAEHPLRERLRGQLMLALYRAGRQADALRCYREARETLVGELGLEPSVPLQRLERAILNQDLSLEAPSGVARAVPPTTTPTPAPTPTPTPGITAAAAAAHRVRNRRVAAGLLAGVVVAALLAALALLPERSSPRLGPEMIGLLDPASGRVLAKTPAPDRLTAIAGAAGVVWVAAADGTVSRLDADHPRAVETFATGGHPAALTITTDSVWVVDQDSRTVALLDPQARRVVRRVPVGNGASAIAAGAGAVWVTNTIDGTLTRIDPIQARAVRTIAIGGEPGAVAAGQGAVWVSNAGTDTVAKVDPRTNAVIASITVGAAPGAIAVAGDGVWVANTLDGTVSRIDPRLNAVAATIAVGASADALAAYGHAAWIASSSNAELTRIDTTTNRLLRPLEVGSPVGAVAATGDGVAVATVAASAQAGGTLRMVGDDGLPITLDPATWWSTTGWSILSATNDGLLTYRRAGGAAGNSIVPDLARSLPLLGSGDTRYTFQLRRGLGYSTGRPVRASDVRWSIERLWRLRSPAIAELPHLRLVGESTCAKHPARCDLSRAIVSDDRSGTVTFRLSRPNPLFLQLLALPFYQVLPRGTAARDGRLLPATGPYRIARYVPGKTLELVRNDRFHEWSQAAQPDGFADRILWRLDRPQAGALADVIAGRADYLVGEMPPSPPATIKTHHASQLHSNPEPWLRYVFLNTRIPPFDNLDARRALNLAVDRSLVAQLLGGPLQARPTCQVLPPSFPGYRPICPYTLRPNAGGSWTSPNLDAARALVRRSGTLTSPVVAWTDTRPQNRALGGYLVRVLRTLGYRARLATLPFSRYYQHVGDSRSHAQLGTAAWFSEPHAPANFFMPLVSCASFRARSAQNKNLSGFCDPQLDALMRRAARAGSTDQARAARLWAALDSALVAKAPWVPLVTLRSVTVVSKRLRNYRHHPILGGLMISQALIT